MPPGFARKLRFALEEIVARVLALLRIRFLRTTALARIGHLAFEPDIFIKLRRLGMRGPYLSIILCPPGAAANDCLLGYWSRRMLVVRSPIWVRILRRFERFPFLQYDVSRYVVAIDETAPFIEIIRAWGDRPALLGLDAGHRRRGRAWLARLGVPEDAEIICFHCREGGYSPADEELHSFRNCSIDNYLPAVAELTKRGYWCFRMGDPTMRRFQAMDRVVDLAHLESRADWQDIYLLASCKFFLGSASGLAQATNVFGRPCAVANLAPLSTVTQFGPRDIAIPKLLWSETHARYLGFSETFDAPISNFRFTRLYREHGIRPEENTAEDVRNLALEMLERSEGRAAYTPEDEELQRRFRARMRPGHYAYGGVNRVGRDFLRKYASLLGD